MIKRVVVLPDVHLEQDAHSNVYTLVKKYIQFVRPDEVIILGDFMNCASLSFHDLGKLKNQENKRYSLECEYANNELDFLQRYSKQQTYIEGNHEERVNRWIVQDPQKLSGVVDLPITLCLKQRRIKWKPLNSLYARGKCYFTHGVYINQYHAAKHLQRFGCCLVYGHTHTAQTHQMNMKMQDPIMAYGLGCLCDHEPDYMKGKPANWINQFAELYYDEKSGKFNLDTINITSGQFIREGKVYR
jgi:predicted phosphodiesterase